MDYGGKQGHGWETSVCQCEGFNINKKSEGSLKIFNKKTSSNLLDRDYCTENINECFYHVRMNGMFY